MDINDFQEDMLNVFYERTQYDKIKISIVLCENIYECALKYSPCEKHKKMLLTNKESIKILNGLSFPKSILDDGYFAIISKKIFNYKDNTFLGTYMHEITHAHDFDVFAKYINATTTEDIYNSMYYDTAMGIISEFNARKNGFSYVREKSYCFFNLEEESDYILSKEIPYVISKSGNLEDIYSLTQLFGRMAVFDSKTKERARYCFYEFLSKIFNQHTYDNITKMYEILYKFQGEKNNINFCLPEIHSIMNSLF